MLLGMVALVALSLPQQADTVIPVRAGTRLQVENFNGATTIRTWDKNAIRIVAEGDERNRLDIRNLGTVISLKSQSRYGPPHNVEYQITVPARTDLTIGGVNNDINVEGVAGAIEANTVNGAIEVRGGDGFITLKSVDGEVTLTDAKGRIAVSSVNEAIRLSNVTGEISAETVNGEINLTGITSASVTATTVNGEVSYDGVIQDHGQYSFTTHNGDISVSVPEGTNATVDVNTFSGELEPSFPVQVTTMSRNHFSFVVGSGSARVNLESFQGTIQLHRPGEAGGSGKYRVKSRHRGRE